MSINNSSIIGDQEFQSQISDSYLKFFSYCEVGSRVHHMAYLEGKAVLAFFASDGFWR